MGRRGNKKAGSSAAKIFEMYSPEALFVALLSRFCFGRNRKEVKLANVLYFGQVIIACLVAPMALSFALLVSFNAPSKSAVLINATYGGGVGNETFGNGTVCSSNSSSSAFEKWVAVSIVLSAFGTAILFALREFSKQTGNILDNGAFMVFMRKALCIKPHSENFPIVTALTATGWKKLGTEHFGDAMWDQRMPACHVMAHTLFETLLEFEKSGKVAAFVYGTGGKARRDEKTQFPTFDFNYKHRHSFLYSDIGKLVQSFASDMDSYTPICIDLRQLSMDVKTILRSTSLSKSLKKVESLTNVGGEFINDDGETKRAKKIVNMLKKADTPLYQFLISEETEEKYKLDDNKKGVYYLLTNLRKEDYNVLCLPQSALGDEGFEHETLMCCRCKIFSR